jgi:hypothetical protein
LRKICHVDDRLQNGFVWQNSHFSHLARTSCLQARNPFGSVMGLRINFMPPILPRLADFRHKVEDGKVFPYVLLSHPQEEHEQGIALFAHDRPHQMCISSAL